MAARRTIVRVSISFPYNPPAREAHRQAHGRPLIHRSMPPKHDPDVWLFDLDNTLYPARCNLFAQIDVRIGRYIADCLKVDVEEARRVQKQLWRDHGTSMRGMMSLHGVDPVHY